MNSEEAIRVKTLQANGLHFETLTCGEGNRLALLLHGFPETADSWRAQMPALAGLGYRVWAPNQRGYAGSSRPHAMQDYAIEHLMSDVAGLIDLARQSYGVREVVLVAHDWGALVAWCFAARRVRELERMVIVNVPHPACFARELRRSLVQKLRSWYVAFFQLPVLPEWLLSRKGGRAVGKMMLRTSTAPDRFPPDLIASCCRNAAQPGAARAMVNWYRAFVRGGGLRRQLRLGFPVIEIPVLLLWGEADTALSRSTTDGTEQYASQLTKRFLPGVSHWVQQDATEVCNGALREFLGRAEPAGTAAGAA